MFTTPFSGQWIAWGLTLLPSGFRGDPFCRWRPTEADKMPYHSRVHASLNAARGTDSRPGQISLAFFVLSLSSSSYRARKMKTNQPSPHQWCRDENTFPACIRNSFAKPPALSALRRCSDTYFPDKMKHMFLYVHYITMCCTIQAIIGWLFILTTEGGGFQATFPVRLILRIQT